MKTVIEMAREAGGDDLFDAMQVKFLERFAELVRADEREACAKVCEDAFSSSHAGRVICDNLAFAIRARSST